MPIDLPAKYMSAEDEEQHVKRTKERRAGALADFVKDAMPEQFFGRDYLQTGSDKNFLVSLLDRHLALVSKRLTCMLLGLVSRETDKPEDLMVFQRNRCRFLEAEAVALKGASA